LCAIEEGVQLLCHCHWQRESRERLTLLIVHGLEGSSRSRYVIGTGSRAWRQGWNVVRMNIRGCGSTEHLSETLYHSGLSQDVEKLTRWLIASRGLRRIALAGFSMGGNQVLRALGRWGAEAPAEVVAGAAISPSCDLALCSARIHEPQNKLYEWWFVRSLRASFLRKAEMWPGKFDPSLLRRVHSVRDFDEHITARYMGFAGADDYYDKASSAHVLERIAVPTLVINADDDPFIVISAESRRKLRENPKVTFLESARGGHCSFLCEPKEGDDGRWAEAKIVEFLSQVECARRR
jgi:predicted alpha/beta-fold hydrolase